MIFCPIVIISESGRFCISELRNACNSNQLWDSLPNPCCLEIVYVLMHNQLIVFAVSTRCSWMLLVLKFFKLKMMWSVPWKKLLPRNFWVWVIIIIWLWLITIMCTETFWKISLFRSVKFWIWYTYLWFDNLKLLVCQVSDCCFHFFYKSLTHTKLF